MSCVAKVPDLRRTIYEVIRMIEEIQQSYLENRPSAEENKKKVYTTMRRLHDCLKPFFWRMLSKFQVTIAKNSSNAELNILFLYINGFKCIRALYYQTSLYG